MRSFAYKAVGFIGGVWGMSLNLPARFVNAVVPQRAETETILPPQSLLHLVTSVNPKTRSNESSFAAHFRATDRTLLLKQTKHSEQ